MSLLGNIVWFVFGGFLSFLLYLLGGLVLCLTLVGIPFGLQSIKLGVAVLAPFPDRATAVLIVADAPASRGSAGAATAPFAVRSA